MKYIFVVIVSTCPKHTPRTVGVFAYSFPTLAKLLLAPCTGISVFLSVN
jgi:hypothetical protein